jgi:putative phosphoribosyl transferase
MRWTHHEERLFADRHDAGKFLAGKLEKYANEKDAIVLGLPRGGVPVAFEISRQLHLPLDIFLVRKLGAPIYEELAMGAIASGGVRIMNPDVVRKLGITEEVIESVAQVEERELARREVHYRGNREPLNLENKTVILVDDGLATGASMRAAVAALRLHHPGKIVVAVPVGAAETCRLLQTEADEVVCGIAPEEFVAVGKWYSDFRQTSDEEVISLLNTASHRSKIQQKIDEHPERFSMFI